MDITRVPPRAHGWCRGDRTARPPLVTRQSPLSTALWVVASTALDFAQTACAPPSPYDTASRGVVARPPRVQRMHSSAAQRLIYISIGLCQCGAWLMSLRCLLAGSIPALPLFSLAGRGGPPLLSTSSHPSWPISTSAVPKDTGATDNSALALPGFSSVPPKLVKRLLEKQYVEMWEMLPETWQLEAESTCCRTKCPKRSLVTDISVWTECFATMAAVLSSAYPDKAPHFFAYLRTITKASRTFDTTAWASYDSAFRRQAANRGSLDWRLIDPALYNEAFAGRAKVIPRCRYCLGDTHASSECSNAPDGTTHGHEINSASRPARTPKWEGHRGKDTL